MASVEVMVTQPPHDCPHNSFKWSCTHCGGTGLCKHNKPSCFECGMTGKCIHQRRHYLCKECKGGGICQHNHARYYCKECPGPGICAHGKMKRYCSERKSIPNELCEHRRAKQCCEDCKKAAPKPAALSEANLEAHDFRLDFAADVVRSFPQKRKSEAVE